MRNEDLLDDRDASEWLRLALRTALERDPVEAANDAERLRSILQRRLSQIAEDDGPAPPRETDHR